MPERSLSEEMRGPWLLHEGDSGTMHFLVPVFDMKRFRVGTAALEAKNARLQNVLKAARDVGDLDCPYLGDCPENRLKQAIYEFDQK